MSTETRKLLGESDNNKIVTPEKETPSEIMSHHNYNECFPITSLDRITDIIDNPPFWANKTLPLKRRSNTVVQNIISDCHTDYKKFSAKIRIDRRFVPKTLVCHDYKGGYLEDKYLSSTNIGNLYSFYNWAHIDIFVYFSHHLITIPPTCWINAAHKNGVKILGTLITEFTPGKEVCEKIFKDEDTMRIFATSLVQILKIFNFDGWLLNIENSLDDTEMLKKFVSYLTVLVHEQNSEHLIIWYDSIIETGELKWQNELNPLNKYFFDHCDGIFLNYVWTEDNIKNTVDFAKYRSLDVFVGVDVFGRNTYGGGHFNCFKAAQVIRRHHLSMAIFAPGWTHETLTTNHENHQEFFKDFINRDSAFWNSLWPYLYTHPITDFFRTDFFMGVDQDEYNIFSQNQQLSVIKHPNSLETIPNYTEIPTLNNKCNCLQCSFTEKGVRCLVTKQFLSSSTCYVHRLFTCDLALSGIITVYFITKKVGVAELGLSLLVVNGSGAFKKIKCNARFKSNLIDNLSLMEVNPSTNLFLIEYVKNHYRHLFREETLSITVFQFSVNSCKLLEIGCTLEEGQTIDLCAFGIERNVPLS